VRKQHEKENNNINNMLDIDDILGGGFNSSQAP